MDDGKSNRHRGSYILRISDLLKIGPDTNPKVEEKIVQDIRSATIYLAWTVPYAVKIKIKLRYSIHAEYLSFAIANDGFPNNWIHQLIYQVVNDEQNGGFPYAEIEDFHQ